MDVIGSIVVCVIVQSIDLVTMSPAPFNLYIHVLKQYELLNLHVNGRVHSKTSSKVHPRGKTIGKGHNRWDRTLY